jgi:hypothetical protein
VAAVEREQRDRYAHEDEFNRLRAINRDLKAELRERDRELRERDRAIASLRGAGGGARSPGEVLRSVARRAKRRLDARRGRSGGRRDDADR